MRSVETLIRTLFISKGLLVLSPGAGTYEAVPR